MVQLCDLPQKGITAPTLVSRLLGIFWNPSRVRSPSIFAFFKIQASLRSDCRFVAKFPWITYSDLWTLGGVCAIQEMQGPDIPWRPGRSDRDVSMCTPDGRLPDASKEQNHLRGIFGRMGFDDREIVALSGAHALGRCHTDRSGYDGPWTFSPTVLTNDYFKLLLEEKWEFKKVGACGFPHFLSKMRNVSYERNQLTCSIVEWSQTISRR